MAIVSTIALVAVILAVMSVMGITYYAWDRVQARRAAHARAVRAALREAAARKRTYGMADDAAIWN